MAGSKDEHETGATPPNKLPTSSTTSPLVVDTSESMDVDSENEPHDDIEQDIQRFRNQRANATRTLYHQHRGDDDTINSTRSLYDTDVVYLEIHGRRYCGDYYMPNDEDEQTRMQMLHEVHRFILNGMLTTVPLESPSKILDVGTGCGDWAMAMGDEYPDAEVTGTDIAKIQPSAVPVNVFFEIDDAEEEGGWTYAEDSFDLVHFRTMRGAFTDWKHIYKEAYKALKPGGWIEVKDFDDHEAMLQFFPVGSLLQPWMAAIDQGSEKSGRPRGMKHLDHKLFIELGFMDVSTEEYKIPVGGWPDDPEERKIGKLFLLAQLCGIEALCLRILTEQMGWDPVEVRRICDMVTDDVQMIVKDAERARGLGFLVRVVKARKPALDEQDHDRKSDSTTRNSSNAQGHDNTVNGV